MANTCWNCGGSVSERFCPQCKALQPPASDYYEFLDLPRRLSIDVKDLETRFYALSRKLHPDLFSRRSEKEREYSLEATAILNDAYRTLREPTARAQYVLKQQGFDVAEQGTKEVPAELLEEVFELNMALEELKSGDEDAREQIVAVRTRFLGTRGDLDRHLEAAFLRWDAGQNKDELAAVRGLLNRRKYITNLIAQTETA